MPQRPIRPRRTTQRRQPGAVRGHTSRPVPRQPASRRPQRPPAEDEYYDEYGEEENEPPVNPFITSKSDMRRNLVAVYMILLGGLIVAGIFVAVGMDSGDGKEIVLKDDKLAPEIDVAELQKAGSAGERELNRFVTSTLKVKKRVEATIQKVNSLDAVVSEMRETKTRGGEDAEYDPGSAHRASCGSPELTYYFVLRGKLPNIYKNAEENIEYMIFRLYKSEKDMRAGLEEAKADKETTRIVRLGRYCFVQHTEIIFGPALRAITEGAPNAFLRGVQSVIKPST